MTIESNLDSIAHSLKIIADLLTVQTATKAVTNAPISQAPIPAPVQVAAPVVPVPEPVVTVSAVAVPASAPVVPVMPAAPTFEVTPSPSSMVAMAAVANAPPVAVFKDKSAMMDWIMSTYRALGAEKGAKIQDVLTAMGFANINDVPADKWVQLKAGIESLKG